MVYNVHGITWHLYLTLASCWWEALSVWICPDWQTSRRGTAKCSLDLINWNESIFDLQDWNALSASDTISVIFFGALCEVVPSLEASFWCSCRIEVEPFLTVTSPEASQASKLKVRAKSVRKILLFRQLIWPSDMLQSLQTFGVNRSGEVDKSDQN